MPKLSKKTLEKMFVCPTCGEPFRTRQGLSGHRQFKHKEQQPSEDKLINDLIKMGTLAVVMKKLEFTQTEINLLIPIVQRWLKIKAICTIFEITPNKQDYKDYLLRSLTEIY